MGAGAKVLLGHHFGVTSLGRGFAFGGAKLAASTEGAGSKVGKMLFVF